MGLQVQVQVQLQLQSLISFPPPSPVLLAALPPIASGPRRSLKGTTIELKYGLVAIEGLELGRVVEPLHKY